MVLHAYFDDSPVIPSSYELLIVFVNSLQMPIREACHIAMQRNKPNKHRLWKHAQARQNAQGQGPTPVLQIVSTSTCLMSITMHAWMRSIHHLFIVFLSCW